MFEIEGTKSLDSNAITFVKEGVNFVGRTFENNGIQGKIEKQVFNPNDAFTITATVIGNYKYVKYQKEPYYCSQNINKLTPRQDIKIWNERIAYFFVANIQKFVSLYNGQQAGYKLEDINNHVIKLPIKNGEIDFEFMEKFVAELESRRVAELESYLLATGLKDYILTNEEEKALVKITTGDIVYKQFSFSQIFNNIKQGRRLKNSDQIKGNIPFVMAGLTNNGVANYISNPIAIFPESSITIDIFGNTFYRNYSFGAGDDTGVYYSTIEDYGVKTMLYFTTAMSKAIAGKFSFGKKLRSSQSLNFNMFLPVKDGKPYYEIMEAFISAIQKLVIKDVVLYADQKIEATKGVINK